MTDNEQLAIIPAQLLSEIEVFISSHRGITHKEAEPAVNALRNHRTEGVVAYIQHNERVAKLQEELSLLHQRLAEIEQKQE